jgi:hypothetical protein
MAMRFRILLWIGVFGVVFVQSFTPFWQRLEKRCTKDLSSQVMPRFLDIVVLVHKPDHPNRYAVDAYPDINPQSKLVTDVADQDVEAINQDLRASVGENSQNVYFKILQRGNGYVDVSLEPPTTRDFWRKNSYRIQNGTIHPQSIVFFGPGFGMIVLIQQTSAGVLAVLGCEALMFIIRRFWRKRSPTQVQHA